jgi:hypothetical protein
VPNVLSSPARWLAVWPVTRELPRQAGDEAPKAVLAASLPGTVGGKALTYKLRAEFAGHYRDTPSAGSDRDLSAEPAGLGMLAI